MIKEERLECTVGYPQTQTLHGGDCGGSAVGSVVTGTLRGRNSGKDL